MDFTKILGSEQRTKDLGGIGNVRLFKAMSSLVRGRGWLFWNSWITNSREMNGWKRTLGISKRRMYIPWDIKWRMVPLIIQASQLVPKYTRFSLC